MAVATREMVQVTRHRFTAEQYQRMAEVGILHEDDRVELIHGEIVEMAAIGACHVYCVEDVDAAIRRGVDQEVRVLVQSPIRVTRDSEPQPDLAIVRRSTDRRALPSVPDILGVVEVSDRSLTYDRRIKLPLYGAAGIPEAWIFDLPNDRIARHTEPHANGYRTTVVVGRGERIISLTVPAVTFDVDEVFGPPEKHDE